MQGGNSKTVHCCTRGLILTVIYIGTNRTITTYICYNKIKYYYYYSYYITDYSVTICQNEALEFISLTYFDCRLVMMGILKILNIIIEIKY